MAPFRDVTPDFAVSPQIAAEDVAAAQRLGFTLIVNNRPDGEAPDQPPSAEIEAAATSRGLDYAHIPIVGRPTTEQAAAMRAVLVARHGKTLAFCRSGTRSITAWALSELITGERKRNEILNLATAAGYDLSSALPL